MPISVKTVLGAAALAALVVAPSGRTAAVSADAAYSAAISVVETLDGELLGAMQDARALGPRGRYKRLAPTMDAVFDMATMTQREAASHWGELTPDQKARLIGAFSGFETAQFAAWFDCYRGQSFHVGAASAGANGTVTVTAVMSGGDVQPLALDYVLTSGADGVWRIVDIRYGGWLSVVERRRDEFSGIFDRQGAEALIAQLVSMRHAALSRDDDVAAPHILQPRTDQWSLPVYPLK